MKASLGSRTDGALRRRLINIMHVLTGNFVGSMIGLVAFALTARLLGPLQYGVLALLFTYVRAVERLITFQSWQPLIKYGAELEGPAHREDLKVLLKFGLALDAAGAALAWLSATVLALIAAPYLGWSQSTLQLVLVYCASLLFNLVGMPTAVMRLSGRFQIMAYSQVFNAIARLAVAFVGLAMGAGLAFFVIAWTVLQICSSLTLITLAFRELHKQEIRNVLRAPLKGVTQRFPKLWNFAWSSNLSATIRTSAQEFDTLLVGALADPASAGLYHIAKRVGRLAQQAGVQVQTVLYPDIARLWAKREVKAFKLAVVQVELVLLAFGITAFVFLFFAAGPLLHVVAGPHFVAAAPLLVVQMGAVTLALTGTSLRSALLAMGRQSQILRIVLIGTVGFHCTAIALVPLIGAMGANIAHIVLALVVLAGLSFVFRRALSENGNATTKTETWVGEPELPD